MKTVTFAAALVLTGLCYAQRGGDVVWAPKPKELTKYVPPHKPHTRLADLKAAHKGQATWRQLIVNDEHLRSEYIQAAPGTKAPKQLHPDTRAWWVVMEGQVRFDIEGQQPVTATRGGMVQVPMQTFFSYEVVGDKPALIFETNIAGAKTLYAKEAQPPEMPGFNWMPVKFSRVVGEYGHNNKPHVTYDQVSQDLEAGKIKGTIRIVEDDRGTANFIYGYNSKLPPLNTKEKGHYHPEGAEYWLIMRGQIRYPIEGQPAPIIATEGDVVYVPKFTWHFPRWWGDGPSCRLAMNGYPNICHLFDAQ